MALIGNNGCGKTTFIKCLLNQLPYKGSLQHTNDIAIIPQNDIVFKNLTLKQCFQAMGTYSDDLIRKLHLEKCLNQLYSQLSGGQKRRLTIGLALSKRPDVLVLDEVTVGSDFMIKEAI